MNETEFERIASKACSAAYHTAPAWDNKAAAKIIEEAFTEKEREIKTVIREFLAQWEVVLPHIQSAFLMQHIHGAPYNGPTLEKELDKLKEVLG